MDTCVMVLIANYAVFRSSGQHQKAIICFFDSRQEILPELYAISLKHN